MRIRPDVKHIKISDFPRTPWPVSFGVRQALMKGFNYCRQYPDKMRSFQAVLAFMQQKIAEWEASAQEVAFEGGSQKRPIVSGTNVHPALTTEPSGELQKVIQPKQKVSDAIEFNDEHPVGSTHTPVNGALVSEVQQRPPMPQGNPLKPGFAKSAHVEQVEQAEHTLEAEAAGGPAPVVEQQPVLQPQATGLPDLAAVLARNAQA